MDCDVLVIGSGMAAVSAAHASANQGAQVCLVTSTNNVEDAHSWTSGGMHGVVRESADWREHAFQTIMGSAYLADQDAVEVMCRDVSVCILEVISYGVRCDLGLYGLGPRPYKTPNLTAPVVLAALWQAALKTERIQVRTLTKVAALAVDENGRVVGCWVTSGGSKLPELLCGRVTILATGGATGIFSRSTNRGISLGAGIVLGYQVGAELTDLEMIQHHPTTLADGTHVSEAVRVAGAVLRNRSRNAFMEEFAPRTRNRAPRDLVVRAMVHQVESGLGDEGGNVWLDATSLSACLHDIPPIRQFRTDSLRLTGIDPINDLVPVKPGAHYSMGGIATDVDGRTTVSGLYAAGETACLSAHGANRLGGNSLTECRVFGRRAGLAAAHEALANAAVKNSNAVSPISNPTHRNHDGLSMFEHARRCSDIALGPIRESGEMSKALSELDFAFSRIWVANDIGSTALVTALTLASALKRPESCGAHFVRDNTSVRDFEGSVHMTITRGVDGMPIIRTRPVRITHWPIQERNY